MCRDSISKKITEDEIRKHLTPQFADIPIFVYDEIDSTNKQAVSFAKSGNKKNALFVADAQTNGRGRLGRSFFSPHGTGLYFSFLFFSDASAEELSAVTPFAAVATANALEKISGTKVGIKWVNDLYISEKKICGILTELISPTSFKEQNGVVVGIGINLSTNCFPEDLQNKAGALGFLPDRNALVADIASSLEKFSKNPFSREHMSEYISHSVVLGRKVVLDRWGEQFEGTVVGFDKNGGLLLDMGKESPRLFTGGEITLRLS